MNILRIAWWDLRRMLKDKMAVFWWLLMPLMFIYFFAKMMNSPQQVNTWIPIFNYDEHELSQIFIEQLKKEGFSIDVRKPGDEPYLQGWSRALIIPATFSADLLKGSRVHVSFLKGEGNSQNTLSAQTRVLRNVIQFTGALASVDVVNNRWTKLTRENFLNELNKPLQLQAVNRRRPALRPPPYGFALSLPGYLVMFVLMVSIMYGGITLTEERSKKQLVRIIAAPLHPVEIFVGKLLGRMFQPALQAFMILAAGYFLFGVNLGDHPSALFPVIFCFSFFCGALGVLFGVICSTEQQVSSMGILVTMLLSAMGGCWWPMEIVPEFFKSVMLFIPTYWALQGFHDVMAFGKSFAGVAPECISLVVFSFFILWAAVPLFEWRKREL
ncbi:MAG: ABC transporter permease [Candidatus Hinthialibacter sp.]